MGHLGTLKLFHKKGADVFQDDHRPDDRDKRKRWTPAYGAARNGHLKVVKWLVNIRRLRKGFAWEVLFVAAEEGHLSIVKYLVKCSYASIDSVDEHGMNCIHAAAMNGHLDVVQFLAQSGASIHLADNDGRSPIFVAAQRGRLNVVQYLAQSGANVNLADNDGWSPLYVAAQRGHLNIVQCLVQSGANIHQGNNRGYTPVYIASVGGHVEILKWLVQKGADINKVFQGSVTAVAVAADSELKEVVKVLIGLGVSVYFEKLASCYRRDSYLRNKLHSYLLSIKEPEHETVEDVVSYFVRTYEFETRWERRRSYAIFLSTIKHQPTPDDERVGTGDNGSRNSDTTEQSEAAFSPVRVTSFTVARDRVLEGKDMQRAIGKFL